MSELNRREFVVAAGVAACGCAALGESEALAGDPAPKLTKCGPLTGYANDGIYDKYANKALALLIIRNNNRLYASSANCTHKNCVVKKDGQELKCPCHGSVFSIHGTVINGQASSSLPRFAIAVDKDGIVVVDRAKRFREKDWELEGAFIDVTKKS